MVKAYSPRMPTGGSLVTFSKTSKKFGLLEGPKTKVKPTGHMSQRLPDNEKCDKDLN